MSDMARFLGVLVFALTTATDVSAKPKVVFFPVVPLTGEVKAEPAQQMTRVILEEFQQQDMASQAATFGNYLQELVAGINELEETDPNRQGMLIVQQVCEQMYPFIAEGQMALGETIVVALTPEQAAATDDFNVIDLLKN